MIKMTMTGVATTLGAIKGIEVGAKKSLEIAMEKAVNILYEEAKKECPVKTGLLRNSAEKLVKWMTATLLLGRVDFGSPEAYYAYFVHEGTVKMGPNPFLKRALAKKYREIEAILGKGIKTAIGGWIVK